MCLFDCLFICQGVKCPVQKGEQWMANFSYDVPQDTPKIDVLLRIIYKDPEGQQQLCAQTIVNIVP